MEWQQNVQKRFVTFAGKRQYGSFNQVGARFVTVSIVTSVNVPPIILDHRCTFTVVLQIRMKSISPPSIGNYNNVN